MERRVNATEVRASGSKEMRVSGYAARYNSLSNKLGGEKGTHTFRERIASGAFNRILKTKPDVVMLLNHDPNYPLGRTSAGTLTLRSDDKGLCFDCLLPNTQAGRDTHESVKRGDLKACSFAFNLGERMDDWTEEEEIEDEKDLGIRGKAKRAATCIIRTIRDFSSLLDCSVVTYPAYASTSVDARSLISAEVRSHVASFRNGRVLRGSTPVPAGIAKNFGVYYAKDDSSEQLVIARRRALLSQI